MPRRVRQILIALSLVALGWSWASSALAQPTAGEAIAAYLKNADQFYREGKFDYALAEYQKVLKLDPNNLYAQTQVTALRRQLGLETAPPAGSDKATPNPSMVPDQGNWPVLPPRDYAKITTALDAPFVSSQHGFSMRPPAGWWVDQYSKKHAVTFRDTNSEAYLFVDVIPVKGNFEVDAAFRKFVEQQTKAIEDAIGGFHPDYQNVTNFLGKNAFETRATFLAGPNTARLHVLYVPAPGKVFQITSVCDDRLARFWSQIFDASLATFTLTSQ